MKILRGPYAGQTVDLVSYCNDWVQFQVPGGRSDVESPRNVQIEDHERAMFDRGPQARPRGTFWQEWRLEDDGTFTGLDFQPPADEDDGAPFAQIIDLSPRRRPRIAPA